MTLQGSWSKTDFTARRYRAEQLTVCLSGADRDIGRLLQRKEEIARFVRWKEEKWTEAGAELVVDIFATPREEPAMSRSEELCEALAGVWRLAVTEEVEQSCREWQRLRPVGLQVEAYQEVRRDLERREEVLDELFQPNGAEDSN